MERLNEVRFMGNVGMIKASDSHTYLAIAINESYKSKGADDWTDKTERTDDTWHTLGQIWLPLNTLWLFGRFLISV